MKNWGLFTCRSNDNSSGSESSVIQKVDWIFSVFLLKECLRQNDSVTSTQWVRDQCRRLLPASLTLRVWGGNQYVVSPYTAFWEHAEMHQMMAGTPQLTSGLLAIRHRSEAKCFYLKKTKTKKLCIYE